MSPAHPTIDGNSIGWITESEMIEVDRVMIEDLGITLIQMMENAGRNLARLVLELFDPDRVAVVSGSGGNGGGGMVAARHLANAGVDVTVTTTRPIDELDGVPKRQLQILRRIGVGTSDRLPESEVVVDALIGYSLKGAPRGRSAELIDSVNSASAAIVSLDTPSGLDVTTGSTPGAVVSAHCTMTLCLPKRGLRDHPSVGDLYLADISVPPKVTAPLGAAAPDFRRGPVLRVT